MTRKCGKCETDNPAGAKVCQECNAPLSPVKKPSSPKKRTEKLLDSGFSAGEVVADRYRILDDVGQSEMGHTFRALDTHNHKHVALYFLKSKDAKDNKIFATKNMDFEMFQLGRKDKDKKWVLVFPEKRKRKRKECQVNVNVTVVDKKKPKKTDHLKTQARDISLDGVKITTEKPLSLNTSTKLEFIFNELNKTFKAEGIVRWINYRNDSKIYEIGLEFIDIFPRNIITLMEYIYGHPS